MQQFVVPQFIDVEDKVIGPITVRQFIIILVGGGLIFISYKLSDFALFLFEAVTIAILVITLAFIKINGRPIHYFLLNFIQTSKAPKLRVWHKLNYKAKSKKAAKEDQVELPPQILSKNTVRSSRLAEMALIVDTGGVYQGEPEPILNQNKNDLT